MLPAALILGGLCFAIGWIFKDYRWTKAANTGKVMVVDGIMYKVKKYIEPNEGGE